MPSYLPKPPWPELQREDSLARGLVAAWPFYEGGGGTVHDLSGNRNTGTLANGVSWSAGPFGSCLLFNGALSQYVTIPNSSSFASPNLTISTWFKTTTTGVLQDLLRQDSNTGGARNWALRLNTSNQLEAFTVFGGVPIIHSTSTVTDGKWHHAVFLLKANGANTDLTLYLDGQSVATGTATALNPTPSDAIYIGSSAWGESFTGSQDGVSIHNRALSASEVAQLYFDPFAIYRRPSRLWQVPFGLPPHPGYISKPARPELQLENPLAYGLTRSWPFSENAGGQVSDLAGKKAVGSIQGSAPWIASPVGAALSFNGSNQYVTTGVPIEQTSPFAACSIAAWVNPASSVAGYIVTNSGASGPGFYLYWDGPNSRVLLGIYDGASDAEVHSSALSTNTWHHIVGTWNGLALSGPVGFRLYVDGVLDTTATNAGTPTGPYISGTTWNIGATTAGTTPLNGKIAGVHIWNRALSVLEAKQLYYDHFDIHRRRTRWWDIAFPPPVIIDAPDGWFDPEIVAGSWFEPELVSRAAWFEREDVVPAVGSVASSAATSAGQAVGASTFSGVGASAAVASAAAVGRSAAASAGSAAATAGGNAVPEAHGVSAATASGQAVGASAAASTGASAATALASGVGASAAASPGTSAGTSTGQATGRSTAAAVGSSAATSSGAAAGLAVYAAIGSSAAAASGSAVGAATDAATASSTAAASATATGASAASSTGSAAAAAAGSAASASAAASPGSSAAAASGQAIGASVAAAVGSSAATSTGTGVSQLGAGAGSSAATSTGAAVGQSVAAATATSAATSSGAAVGQSAAAATAASTATATAASTGSSAARAVGAATGVATGQAAGLSAARSVGTASASSVGAATGAATFAGVGASTSTSTAVAVGTGTILAVGASDALSSGQAIGTAIARAIASSTALSGGNAVQGGAVQAVANSAAIADAVAVGFAYVVVFAVGFSAAHSTAQAHPYVPSPDHVVVSAGEARVVEAASGERVSISSTIKKVSRSD